MENVSNQTRCGTGIRGVAMAIDSVVWLGLAFIAGFAVGAATGQLETTAEGIEASLEGGPAFGALALWLGLAIGYHTLLEWRFGKTIGKHLVAIRVVRDGHAPLTFRASLVRNVFRLIDWLPLFYVVGIGSMLFSTRKKRLGDRIGRTVVVRS